MAKASGRGASLAAQVRGVAPGRGSLTQPVWRTQVVV